MQASSKRIMTGVMFFSSTVVIAVIGYVMAGWTVLDAIYMVVITIFGVGYGEVKPLTSPQLKIFTILVIIAGVLSVAYTVSGFVQLITEGEIRRALNLRRMTQEIERLAGHTIVCGFGRIGQILARKLKDEQQSFIVLDSNPERTTQARDLGYLACHGNAMDEESLKAVRIDSAKALATVLPDDASNVFITLTARGLNPDLMILARGEMVSTEKKLRLAGADHVVLPASIGAMRMAQLIAHPAAMDFLAQSDGRANLNELLAELDVQVSELLIDAASNLVGATISDIEVRGKGTFIIVALRRANGEVLIHPSPSTFLAQGDSLILMGHQGDIPQFLKRYALKSELRYRGARTR